MSDRSAADDRARRLAAALRTNLRRRKAAPVGRDAEPEDADADQDKAPRLTDGASGG